MPTLDWIITSCHHFQLEIQDSGKVNFMQLSFKTPSHEHQKKIIANPMESELLISPEPELRPLD